jgi:hypothetical protein
MQGGQFQTQPRMLSFREFAISMLDPTDRANKIDQVRQARYNLYKESFRAEQTRAFFDAHKDEDWFRLRYHPSEAAGRKTEQRRVIQKRLRIFRDLHARHPDVALHASQDGQLKSLYKFLDACLIKLEDGDDHDLSILEQIYNKDDVGNVSKTESSLCEKKSAHPKDRKKKAKKSSSKGSDNSGQEEEEGSASESSEEEDGKLKDETKDEKSEVNNLPVPKKTQSIFFKHLPVNVTRQDMENVSDFSA